MTRRTGTSEELTLLRNLEELVRGEMADADSGRIERPNGHGSSVELAPEAESAIYAVLSRLETVREKLNEKTRGARVARRNGL